MEVKIFFFMHIIALILCSFVVDTLATTTEPTLTTDQLALLALKARVSSDPDQVLRNWTTSSSVCNWIGVTCGKHHHRVTGLNLSSMGLAGSIPREFGNLSFLISFDIKQNHFEGTLPDDLARLGRLKYMRLSYNDFTGEVPSWLSSFPHLQYLSLISNNFTSLNPFFKSFSNESKLSTLFVSGIPFLGEFPKSIGNLHNLKVLEMYGNGFSGTLPDNIFTGLPMLEVLTLEGNNIQGQIPSSIFACTRLRFLDLSGNQFNGTLIPQNIGNLTTLGSSEFGLIYWGLAYNKFTGKIPHTIGNLSNLLAISFTVNQFIGEIPPSICKLSSLVFLDLSVNHLNGVLPNCVGNFSQGLLAFYLNYNHGIDGPIPNTFAKGCSLKLLSFATNQFEGPLPKSLSNCTQLKAIDVGYNKLQGPFPGWVLETLSELQVFIIGSNKFYGTMPEPKEILSSSKLIIFDISMNVFSGPIPTGYFYNFRNGENGPEKGVAQYLTIQYSGNGLHMEIKMDVVVTLKGDLRELSKVPKAFNLIQLSDNMFNGSIPNSFGDLTALKHLILYGNNLSGQIPRTLGHLTALEALDLSSNHLEGEIPRELADLTFLSLFNVSYNNLSGEIPYSKQFSTFQYDSYIGNFELCGGPLPKKCTIQGVEAQAPSTVVPHDKGIFSNGITWQCVLMGYGFGVFVGVVLGIMYF